MSFLENYETANDTIIRFRKEHPTGRVVTSIQDAQFDKGWVIIKAEVFREYEDLVPSAVDFAYGNVATLPKNMQKWFVEDCSTSAISRAIKLLSPSASRPSREDMARVEYEPTPSQSEDDLWATLTITKTESDIGAEPLGNMLTLVKEKAELSPAQSPYCRHGEMQLKHSKPDSSKKWSGWFCKAARGTEQCPVLWQ